MKRKKYCSCSETGSGQNQCFIRRKGDAVFASAIGSLFQYPGVDPVLDENGLCEIFVLGPARTPGNGVFRDIYEVLPGHYLSFADGILKDHCYWNVKSQPHEDSREETVEKQRGSWRIRLNGRWRVKRRSLHFSPAEWTAAL